MKNRFQITIPVIAIVLAAFMPAVARADNLLRLFPLLQGNFLYTDNVKFTPSNAQGDFSSNFAGGFYLDVTTPKRYATLEYSTFASLYLSHSNLDRGGQAQFARITDEEDIAPHTKINLYDWFVRDSPVIMAVTSGDRIPEFTPGFTEFLLANNHVIINTFKADAAHAFNQRWTGQFGIGQETISSEGGSASTLQAASMNLLYRVNEQFSIGPGYRFADFIFPSSTQPNSQVQWPIAHAVWLPAKDLFAEGYIGPMVAYNTTGVARTRVDPGGVLSIRYNPRPFHIAVSGGQQPGLSAGLGAGGVTRFGQGDFAWDITRRITFSANAGYSQVLPAGVSAQLIGYSAGMSERTTSWLTVFARYIGLRREYTGNPTAFTPGSLPSGTEFGRESVANYWAVGASIAFEAFRWSWQ
ncbi:MAG TPA: hypothetical protein VMT58_09850 [Candidatus Binataceae bacterium]|nr:hypothetical protein [Candidatus Binataceae bacterium]